MVTVANAIMKEGGFRAFYVGVATAAYRGALLTAAQAVGYEIRRRAIYF